MVVYRRSENEKLKHFEWRQSAESNATIDALREGPCALLFLRP